jgi:imidazolonepropionase-like amidohydrolase
MTERPAARRAAAALAIIGLVAACSTGPEQTAADLLITGGTVIDPASAERGTVMDIAIDDGRILAVGASLSDRYRADAIIDAAGRYVIPGLADMHTHFGTGVRPAGEDDTTPVLARMLYYGVTTTLNLGSFQAWPARIDSLRTAMDDGTLLGPRLLAAGALITVPGSHPTTTIYSPALQAEIRVIVAGAPANGPIDLALATARATTLVRTVDDMRAEVRRLGDAGADVIKLTVESGPGAFGDDHPQMSSELIAAAVDAAKAYGIPVLCHASSGDELEACLQSGAEGVVHAATDPRGQRDGIERSMAAAGMALIPTASLFEGWMRYPSDPSLLEEPFLAETITAGEREWLGGETMRATFAQGAAWPAAELARLRDHLRAAHDAGVQIIAGTDVGNPYRFPGHSLHEELAFYVSAGLAPMEALATATVNAARLVGDEGVWGSIREGLAADLLVLDASPLEDIANTRRIREVIRGGRVIDRAALPVR